MTDEQKPLTVEQQLSNTIQLAHNLESVNREAKSICDGLIQRCAQLACERDNIGRAAESLKATNESLRGQLLDLTNQLKAAKPPVPAPVVVEEPVLAAA
ncbi:MAG: hypothetical protein RB191_20825 [Terriglobia bacterium]|nr:hypothetical protein [Terriglobia bacterium]